MTRPSFLGGIWHHPLLRNPSNWPLFPHRSGDFLMLTASIPASQARHGPATLPRNRSTRQSGWLGFSMDPFLRWITLNSRCLRIAQKKRSSRSIFAPQPPHRPHHQPPLVPDGRDGAPPPSELRGNAAFVSRNGAYAPETWDPGGAASLGTCWPSASNPDRQDYISSTNRTPSLFLSSNRKSSS